MLAAAVHRKNQPLTVASFRAIKTNPLDRACRSLLKPAVFHGNRLGCPRTEIEHISRPTHEILVKNGRRSGVVEDTWVNERPLATTTDRTDVVAPSGATRTGRNKDLQPMLAFSYTQYGIVGLDKVIISGVVGVDIGQPRQAYRLRLVAQFRGLLVPSLQYQHGVVARRYPGTLPLGKNSDDVTGDDFAGGDCIAGC
jgi:hypothetical protein